MLMVMVVPVVMLVLMLMMIMMMMMMMMMMMVVGGGVNPRKSSPATREMGTSPSYLLLLDLHCPLMMRTTMMITMMIWTSPVLDLTSLLMTMIVSLLWTWT